MGTQIIPVNQWVNVKTPNPGEPVRAAGGVGLPITIEGNNGDANGGVTYTALVSGARIRHKGGILQVLAVAVAGNDVDVQLDTDGAGNPTSTANAVKAAVDAVAAAVLTTAVTGTGAGTAGINAFWVSLAAGVQGSVRTPVQDLGDRTEFLYQRSGIWGPPVEFRCDNGTDLKIRGLGGFGTLSVGAEVTYTPLLGVAGWYYVYAYVSGGAIAWEHSATAPDPMLQYKTGDTTRRYVGCFSISGGTIIPFLATRSTWRYQGPRVVASALGSMAWAAQSMATQVPPIVRCVDLFLKITNKEATPNYLQVRATGATPVTPAALWANQSPGAAFSHASGQFSTPCDANQSIDYLILQSGTGSSGEISVVGWPMYG